MNSIGRDHVSPETVMLMMTLQMATCLAMRTPASPASELVVDAPRLMPLCADHVQASGLCTECSTCSVVLRCDHAQRSHRHVQITTEHCISAAPTTLRRSWTVTALYSASISRKDALSCSDSQSCQVA